MRIVRRYRNQGSAGDHEVSATGARKVCPARAGCGVWGEGADVHFLGLGAFHIPVMVLSALPTGCSPDFGDRFGHRLTSVFLPVWLLGSFWGCKPEPPKFRANQLAKNKPTWLECMYRQTRPSLQAASRQSLGRDWQGAYHERGAYRRK